MKIAYHLSLWAFQRSSGKPQMLGTVQGPWPESRRWSASPARNTFHGDMSGSTCRPTSEMAWQMLLGGFNSQVGQGFGKERFQGWLSRMLPGQVTPLCCIRLSRLREGREGVVWAWWLRWSPFFGQLPCGNKRVLRGPRRLSGSISI